MRQRGGTGMRSPIIQMRDGELLRPSTVMPLIPPTFVGIRKNQMGLSAQILTRFEFDEDAAISRCSFGKHQHLQIRNVIHELR